MELSSYKIVPIEEQEEHKEKDSMENPLTRVEDEFDGWVEYRKMHKETNQDRYKIASQQEFGHLLMAIEDFFSCIQKHQPDAEEAAEFNKMIAQFSMKGI